MIHGLDHIVLAASSVDAAAAGYRLLLGRRPDGASFQLANVRLDLRAPEGAAEGLSALAFAVGDMAKAQRLLQQRACPSNCGRQQIASLAHRAGGNAWSSDVRPRARSWDGRTLVFAAGQRRSGQRCCKPRPRGDPLAKSGARDCALRWPLGTEPAARSHRAQVGRAARLLPLRRSHRRGGARPRGGDRRGSGSAVGPVLARARYRQGPRPVAGSRCRRFRCPRRPPSAHQGLHGEEPHRRCADVDDRRRCRALSG